ncbi:hypothetical protein DSO57_1030508, partial [Entomophthora muscae]
MLTPWEKESPHVPLGSAMWGASKLCHQDELGYYLTSCHREPPCPASPANDWPAASCTQSLAPWATEDPGPQK